MESIIPTRNSVTILIPVYNRLETTKQGLRSLYKGLDYYMANGRGLVHFSVVVIDDGSTDGTQDWISSYYKEIHLLNGNGNLWWTGAINRGANYAIGTLKSNFLLLWNDDVFPEEDYFMTIENLIESGYCENTIVGSKIVFADSPTRIWSSGGFFNRFSGSFGMKSENKGSGERIIKCDWQPGMGTLIPVKSMVSLGLKWDEKRFPQYHGDSDFTLRCRSKGMRIITCFNLILQNNTATTGITRKQSLRDIWLSFTSLRSIYNLKINFRFYSRHGFLPFAYMGMLSKYFFFIGGFVKHSVLKL